MHKLPHHVTTCCNRVVCTGKGVSDALYEESMMQHQFPYATPRPPGNGSNVADAQHDSLASQGYASPQPYTASYGQATPYGNPMVATGQHSNQLQHNMQFANGQGQASPQLNQQSMHAYTGGGSASMSYVPYAHGIGQQQGNAAQLACMQIL